MSNDQPLTPVVSIVIVTYGTGSIVLDALDAIERHTPTVHEVIVVDNLPPDPATRTSTLLAGRTDVTLIEADDNLGFAGGNELGVAHAGGDVLCFLNADVIVGPGWLEPLVAALDDPVVGIAAPVFLNGDRTLQEAGQLIFSDTFTAPIGGPGVMPGDETNVFSRDVDYSSAACWLVRRSEHIARGGFDRRYHPAYFEDTDYALRVEAGGQRTRLVADVPVVHHVGGSIGERDATLGQITHARFKSAWGDRLAERPARPDNDEDAMAARDRLAGHRTLYVVSGDASDAERRAAAVGLLDRAAANPRDRFTLLTDRVLSTSDTDQARRVGLEVVVAAPDDLASVQARRASMADEVVTVGSHSSARTKRAAVTIAVVVAAAIAGIVVRWLLFDSPAAIINADEAYTRLDTFEILRGQFPIVLGGTVYTLPLESYLYTPFTYLFGASVVPLKVLSTLSWVGTSIVLYFIGRRLLSARAGIIAAVMCWLTPGALLILSITAYPAYASGMLVSTLAFLVASMVVDVAAPSRRLLLLFGMLAGFGFWLHPMFLATLVPMVGFVLWTVRRRLDAWLSVIAGGIIGCLPLLAWNAANGWPSLQTPVKVPGTYTERLRTFAEDLLPRAFGLRDAGLVWYHDLLGPLVYLALIGVAILGLVTIVRRPSPRSRMLLLVLLVAVFPIMAVFRNLIYANDGRYAMISFPFLLLAIAGGVDTLAGKRPPLRTIGVFALVAAVWFAAFVQPTTSPYLDQLGTDPNAQLGQIVDVLDEAGITRVYGSYWAVLPVDFAGDNRIVSGVFPFWPIRFPNRQRIVGATPAEDVAVIYMNYDEDPAYLLMPVDRYERIVIGDRVVYLPLAHTG